MRWLVPSKSGPKKGNWWTSYRVTGTQVSLLFVGNEGSPVRSDPTEELLQHKLLKKLMRMVSQCTVQHSLVCLGLRRPVSMNALTPVSTSESTYIGHLSIRNESWHNGGLVWWIFVDSWGNMCHLPVEEMAPGRSMKASQCRECDALLLGNLGPWHLFDVYYVPKCLSRKKHRDTLQELSRNLTKCSRLSRSSVPPNSPDLNPSVCGIMGMEAQPHNF